MADLKISQLPAATVPLAGTEVLPIVQSGSTVQVSVDNVIASRASLGANTFTAAQNWATGTAIASAATINLDTATGNRVHITGTTAITAVTLTRGPRTVIFDGILTLTHNATTNNLPGAANITTAVGDRAIYESDGTTVYCISYIKVSGAAVASVAGALILLSTVNASAASTVDIETTFNSTYDSYLLVASGVTVNVDNNDIKLEMKLSGSYVTANYRYSYNETRSNSATAVIDNSSSVASVPIVPQVGSAAANSCNIRMNISNPASTAFKKQISWVTTSIVSAGNTNTTVGGASNDATGALTGLRFKNVAVSGTISGVFSLYGIVK